MYVGTTIVNFAVDLKTKKICWNACPCVSCAKHLHSKGITRVVFPKFDIDSNKWTVVDTTPEQLLASARVISGGKYARDQRIVGVLC